MIDLRNDITEKGIPQNENSNKLVDSAENILDFNKQQNDKEIKILTPKQMLQGLPTALSPVKVGNTSENLINEVCQIIYSLYQEKEIIKKVHNNIMNSIKL